MYIRIPTKFTHIKNATMCWSSESIKSEKNYIYDIDVGCRVLYSSRNCRDTFSWKES